MSNYISSKVILVAHYNEQEFAERTVIPISYRGCQDRQSLEMDIQYRFNKNGFNKWKIKLNLDQKLASCLRYELLRSPVYRGLFLNNIVNRSGKHLAPRTVVIHINLNPFQHYLDYRFGYEVQLLVNELIELDHMMSWLSTLGGAFSSLGDQFLYCAKTAGRISAQQYKIAEKLGDPVTLIRCQLYLSISLIQCGRLRNARDVIRRAYRTMKSKPEPLQDKRVLSMCLGIYAKLKYTWQIRQVNRKMKRQINVS